jgi:hypothetical protein
MLQPTSEIKIDRLLGTLSTKKSIGPRLKPTRIFEGRRLGDIEDHGDSRLKSPKYRVTFPSQFSRTKRAIACLVDHVQQLHTPEVCQ